MTSSECDNGDGNIRKDGERWRRRGGRKRDQISRGRVINPSISGWVAGVAGICSACSGVWYL